MSVYPHSRRLGILISFLVYIIETVCAVGEFQLSGFCTVGVVEREASDVVGQGQGRVLSLDGRGQHRTLEYTFELKHASPVVEIVDVALVHALPTVWFVDPFETTRVVGKNASVFESHVMDPVDVESIEMFTHSISHALVAWNVSLHEGGVPIDVGIRIHARYANVAKDAGTHMLKGKVLEWLLSDMVPVVFKPFEIYLRSSSGQCTRIRPIQDVLSTHVPAGAARHTYAVVWVTALSITLGFVFTVSNIIQKSSVA